MPGALKGAAASVFLLKAAELVLTMGLRGAWCKNGELK